MPACRQASVRLLRVAVLVLLPLGSTLPLPATAAPAVTVETAAQEIVGLATRTGPMLADQGAAAARPGAVPARHRQPWLAPRRFPASEHGDTDVFRGIELAPPARIHGRAAAASRLWADRRSLAGKLRIVQQPRLLSGRDDHGPGHPNSDRLFPWPTRGAARPYSPDRLVGGRLGIARSRQPKSARRVRSHQFRRRARGRAPQSRQLRAAAPGRRGGPLWLDRPHSHALALRGQRFVFRA